MASVSNEIGDYLSKQMVEWSPYFDCMKLEGMPAISPVKFSELVVKGNSSYMIWIWIHLFSE